MSRAGIVGLLAMMEAMSMSTPLSAAHPGLKGVGGGGGNRTASPGTCEGTLEDGSPCTRTISRNKRLCLGCATRYAEAMEAVKEEAKNGQR